MGGGGETFAWTSSLQLDTSFADVFGGRGGGEGGGGGEGDCTTEPPSSSSVASQQWKGQQSVRGVMPATYNSPAQYATKPHSQAGSSPHVACAQQSWP